jgi:hypothetical protein
MTPAETFRYFMPEDPPIEGCWTWRGNQNTLGYGMIDCSTGGRRHFRANRISYEIFVGPIPDGHVIRHTCDNPPCVQPDHLVPGTPLDNSRDMTSRRRQRSKLAEEQVLEIRALYAAGTSKPELGRRFAVATVTIDAIVRRRNWKHL